MRPLAESASDTRLDFFISYTRTDEGWAEWIAWQLEAVGYRTVLQAWDFHSGQDFIHWMQQALMTADRVLAVLSPNYLASRFGEAEWRAALAKDPTGELGLLVPVRIAPCSPPGLLATRIYIDLVDLGQDAARATLLTKLRQGRGKPPQEPAFPSAMRSPGGRPSVAAPRFPGPSLQDEAEFLYYVTLGAEGTRAVALDLRTDHGHSILELERYAMANKLWRTKVKRLRLPDLLCVRCGRRVEVRAKTKLELMLNHSTEARRAWHSHMRPNDLVAFVLVRPDSAGQVATAAPPTYFSVQHLADAFPKARQHSRIAIGGGYFPVRWPAAISPVTGTVVAVSGGRVTVVCNEREALGRRRAVGRQDFIPYVSVGDSVVAGQTIISGVVHPTVSIVCPGGTWDRERDLHSSQVVDRYVAVKAIGALREAQHQATLHKIADSDDDLRLRLEAAGSLAALDEATWTMRLADHARDQALPDGLALEAILILSELETEAAAAGLRSLAGDTTLPSETRAAAVWGLGSTGLRCYEIVWGFTDDADDLVRVHAVGALGEVPDHLADLLVRALGGAANQAAIAAWLLARERRVSDLLLATRNSEARVWALDGLGRIPPEVVESYGSLPEDVMKALQPLWAGRFGTWLSNEGMSVSLLDSQRRRVRPTACL